MFRIFLSNWRTFVIVLGVILVPLNFVTALLSGMAGLNVGFWDQFSNPASAQAAFETGPDIPAMIGLGVVSLLAGVFINPFVNGMACLVAAETFEGGKPQPRPILQSTAQKYWALIGATILVGLVAIGVLLIPVGLIVAGSVGTADELVGLGGFLMIVAVPALIWLVIRFSLVYPVIVVERVGPTHAMRRSYRLVKGRWWRVFGTLLLAGIVTGIVSQIAAFPFALPGSALGAAAGVIFVTIGSLVAALITTPLTGNVQTLLYYDGRIRSEGYDLEVMTRDVLGGSQPPPPAHDHPFG